MEPVSAWVQPAITLGMDVGSKVVGAILLWIVGRLVIGLVRRLVRNQATSRHLDTTLVSYVDSSVNVLLNIVLVVAVLSVFGVETTTFAGMIAAAGVAIGMAWSGLLANFAAGAFLMVLRPFKVGDLVEANGVLGVVHEIGLFVTTVDTLDNVRTFVGNNAVFSGTIRNYSANPYRRVDLVAQLAHGADVAAAVAALKAGLAKIPNVAGAPAPDVEILTFTLAGPVLAVRPYCHNDHYWQVYFDTNRLIRDGLGALGLPVPEQHLHLTQA